MNTMNDFGKYRFFVLCNGFYDAAFFNKTEALQYLNNKQKTDRMGRKYTLFSVDNGDEKELERIRESYENYMELLKQREEDEWER